MPIVQGGGSHEEPLLASYTYDAPRGGSQQCGSSSE